MTAKGQPDSDPAAPRHPIQVVARRTGLTPDALRAWEKRYEAVTPFRARGGRRLYSDLDVDRLLLLRRATEGGRRIGQVAALSTESLRELVSQDEQAIAEAPSARRTRRGKDAAGADALLADCLDAVAGLDAERLERLLDQARLELSQPQLVESVVAPLMERIGEGWREGKIRIAEEHMATAVVRSLLGALAQSGSRAPTDPVLVVATPAGQIHELGALMAAVAAAADGWRVCYLGPNLPAEEIAASVKDASARGLALSVVYPADDPRLPDELLRLRRLVADDVPILFGGRAAAGYRDALTAIGARALDSIDDLREELGRLRVHA